VVWILKKARQPVADCVVDAEAERAASEPKVFTRIHLRYRVAGRGLDPRQVERAVKLSKEKYCSATIMLAKTAQITFALLTVDREAEIELVGDHRLAAIFHLPRLRSAFADDVEHAKRIQSGALCEVQPFSEPLNDARDANLIHHLGKLAGAGRTHERNGARIS